MVRKFKKNQQIERFYKKYSFFNQILSRVKSDSANSRQSASTLTTKRNIPEFDEFILKRDYTGALTLLEVTELNEKIIFTLNLAKFVPTSILVRCECKQTRDFGEAMESVLQFSFGQLSPSIG